MRACSSAQAEIHVRSPSVKVARQRNSEVAQSFPVFGDHDRIEGVVLLDNALCTTPGRLSISVSVSKSLIKSEADHLTSNLRWKELSSILLQERKYMAITYLMVMPAQFAIPFFFRLWSTSLVDLAVSARLRRFATRSLQASDREGEAPLKPALVL